MELNVWGHSRPNEIFKELDEWCARVARLIQLVALTNLTLQRHREYGDSPSIIKQYEQLLAEHQQELDELLKTHGLALQILPTSGAS